MALDGQDEFSPSSALVTSRVFPADVAASERAGAERDPDALISASPGSLSS